VPSAGDIRERLAGVLVIVYLVFNEGYLARKGDHPVRVDLTDEAIRLGRLLRTLLPDDGEVAGLLALMLLTDARRPARMSRTGQLVTLDEQDRGAWDRTLIAEGNALIRQRLDTVAAGSGSPRRLLADNEKRRSSSSRASIMSPKSLARAAGTARRGRRAPDAVMLRPLREGLRVLLGTTVAFGYAFRVGLTQQNAKTIIHVPGDPLPVGLARSRR
jgi:hypothetical protein